jgi:ABC-type amino acid transport substrate-binding protein
LQNPDYNKNLKIVGEPFTEELYGVAVKKGNSKVLDAINAGLGKVVDSRDYKKLEDKWLR